MKTKSNFGVLNQKKMGIFEMAIVDLDARV